MIDGPLYNLPLHKRNMAELDRIESNIRKAIYMTIATERSRNQIRKTLVEYKNTVDLAHRRIEEIRSEYGEEAAENERTRQEEKIKTARRAAEAAIQTAHSDAVASVRRWGQLDGSQITDDVKLLNAGLVDRDEFIRLKEKYQDNATMLAALKKYGDEQNAKNAASSDGVDFLASNLFSVGDIQTVDDKVNTWNRFQKSAIDELDYIDGSGRYTDPYFSGFRQAFSGNDRLESFGEGVDL